MKRLLVIADHSLVIHGIQLALRQATGFQVAGFLDGRAPITEALGRLAPDIVLVDDTQRRHHALDRLREIAATCPAATSLLLTQEMEPDRLDEAFAAGAEAAISKTIQPVALGSLLRQIALGSIVHRREARAVVAPAREESPLTRRETEILGLVAEGYTNNRIARELWVTEQTVKFHLSNTYRKLGVANRTEASRYAYARDLSDPREQLAHAS